MLLIKSLRIKQALKVSPRLVHASIFKTRSSPSSRFDSMASQKVLVIGSGGFGSCLADHLGSSHPHQVFLYSRSSEVIEAFNRTHKNIKYLKGQASRSPAVVARIEFYPTDHTFSANVTAIGPTLPGRDTLATYGIIVFAIPTQSMR